MFKTNRVIARVLMLALPLLAAFLLPLVSRIARPLGALLGPAVLIAMVVLVIQAWVGMTTPAVAIAAPLNQLLRRLHEDHAGIGSVAASGIENRGCHILRAIALNPGGDGQGIGVQI